LARGALAKRLEPAGVGPPVVERFGRRYFNDLLPLPYTEEALEVVVCKSDACRRRGRQVAIENPPVPGFAHSTLSEPNSSELWVGGAAGLLLDANNIVREGAQSPA